jgi:hypothetical protein
MWSWARVEVVSLVFWVRRVDGFIEEASLNEGYGKRIMGDGSRVGLNFNALSVSLRCVLLLLPCSCTVRVMQNIEMFLGNPVKLQVTSV